MYKAIKIEIKLTKEQKTQVNKTIGTERFIYNEYIKYNQEQYKLGNKFVSAFDFSKYINNVYLPNNPDKKWIKEVSSKSVKQAMIYGEIAFKKFFKGLSSFPVFKKKGKNELGAYFVKNNKKDFEFYRHKIKIPTLKFVRVKEYGYIPKNAIIKSGTITKIADRYFLSLVIEVDDIVKTENTNTKGLGVDLGIKDTAICSNGMVFKNINKTIKIKKLKKKLKREQRKLSKRKEIAKTNNKKLSDSKNYQKQKKVVAKIHNKIRNKRKDFINKLSTDIINNHDIICIEDLNIKGLLKNHKLAKSISDVSWSEFVRQLEYKANWYGRKIVRVPTFYPSSKTCSNCGNVKETLKLSERIYHCECCGLEIDRDYNASINILRKGLEILKEEKVS